MNQKRNLSFLRTIAPWALIGVGAVLAVLGFLIRTAWAPDPFWTASLQPDSDTRLIISEPGVLDLLADEVKIAVAVSAAEDLAEDPDAPDTPEDSEDPEDPADTDDAEGVDDPADSADEEEAGADAAGSEDFDADSIPADPGVVISIARDVDAAGWIGDSAAVRITGLETREILRAEENPGELEFALSADSDLWRHSSVGLETAELDWKKEPGRWSVVIASSSDKQISQVEFTWPQDTATPLALPLLFVGGILLLGGAALLALPQLAPYLRREKTDDRAAKPAKVGSESEPEPTAELETESEPDTKPEPDIESEFETEHAPSEVVPDTPPAPVARFTPGTMTRRQIRELERARRAEALAAQEADSETPNVSPSTADSESEPQQETPDSEDSERPHFSSRSEKWRQTWGVASDTSDTDQISGWLPGEVGDQEEDDE